MPVWIVTPCPVRVSVIRWLKSASMEVITDPVYSTTVTLIPRVVKASHISMPM